MLSATGSDGLAFTSPVDDPQGSATGNLRVRCGGTWHSWPLYARVSYRNVNTSLTRYTLLDFRLLLEAEAAGAPELAEKVGAGATADVASSQSPERTGPQYNAIGYLESRPRR